MTDRERDTEKKTGGENLNDKHTHTHTQSQDGDCRKTRTYDGKKNASRRNTNKTEAGREMEQDIDSELRPASDHPQCRRHYNKCNTENRSNEININSISMQSPAFVSPAVKEG